MASAPRLATSTLASQALAEFSSDVLVGLGQPGQKELPSKYLYDEVGSALFDVICLLPEPGENAMDEAALLWPCRKFIPTVQSVFTNCDR